MVSYLSSIDSRKYAKLWILLIDKRFYTSEDDIFNGDNPFVKGLSEGEISRYNDNRILSNNINQRLYYDSSCRVAQKLRNKN